MMQVMRRTRTVSQTGVDSDIRMYGGGQISIIMEMPQIRSDKTGFYLYPFFSFVLSLAFAFFFNI